MSERIEKAKELLERYGNDTARMLDENPELETLELFPVPGTAVFWHFCSERDSRSRQLIRTCRRLPFCGREKKA